MKITYIPSNNSQKKKVETFLKEWESDSSSILQYSSGSTGAPKAIRLPKWKMKVSAQATGRFLNLETCNSALLCMSIKYIGGKMMVVRSLLHELELLVTEVSSSPLKNIDFPIDFVAMVPLQVEKTLQLHPQKLNLIKHLIIGGAPVSETLRKQLKKFNCNIYSTFGMTETVSHIALQDLKDNERVFKAIGDTTFSVDAEERLQITSKKMKLNCLQTTDVVKLIDAKRFQWMGRSDFVINSGGVKIHPEKVEEKLQPFLSGSEFIISSLPDSSLGNKVVFIGKDSVLKNKIQKIATNHLDRYEIPKEYYFVEELSYTPSGKINRIKTREQITNK